MKNYNIFNDEYIITTIIYISFCFFITVFIFKSTLKDKHETERIAYLLNDIIIPSLAVLLIFGGLGDLEKVADLKGFNPNNDSTEVFDELLQATYLIVAPLLLSLLYNIAIYYRKYLKYKVVIYYRKYLNFKSEKINEK